MREITVTYVIDEDEDKRLNKIVDLYKKQGLDSDSEKMFNFIMTLGCNYSIDEKFKYNENFLSVR